MRCIAAKSIHTLVFSIASISLNAGCDQRGMEIDDPTPEPPLVGDFPASRRMDLDLLFVIDNSWTMLQEQESLAANFPRFMEVLQNMEGGMPNVHIGVTTTDMGVGPQYTAGTGCSAEGDRGALLNNGTCGVSDAYIQDIEGPANGSRIVNYTGDLASAFSCLAQVGITGCGFEQPLESMLQALAPGNPANANFIRPNAYLGVIIVTDEDDCSVRSNELFNDDPALDNIDSSLGPLASFRCFEFGVQCEPDTPRVLGAHENCVPRANSPYMHPVSRYVDFLRGLEDDPDRVLVAGIIGKPTSPIEVETNPVNGNPQLKASCTSTSGFADPAVRLQDFFDQFPQRNTVTTICNEDLAPALALIADSLLRLVGPPCIDGNIDLDAGEPGVQYECVVADVHDPGTANQEETMLPNCSESNGSLPCWHFETDTNQCSTTETQLALIVDRGTEPVPSGTRVQARCVTR